MFPFMNLPLELRTAVYTIVLTPERSYRPRHHSKRTNTGLACSDVSTYDLELSILSTSKQVYNEAKDIFTKNRRFVKVSFNWPGIDVKRELWGIPALQIANHAPGPGDCNLHSLEVKFRTSRRNTLWQNQTTNVSRPLGAYPIHNTLGGNNASGLFYLMFWRDFEDLLRVLSMDMHFWLQSSAVFTIRKSELESESDVWYGKQGSRLPLKQNVEALLAGCQHVEYHTQRRPLELQMTGINQPAGELPPVPGSVEWVESKLQLAQWYKKDTDSVMEEATMGRPSPEVLDGLRMRYEVIGTLCWSALEQFPGADHDLTNPHPLHDARRAFLRSLMILAYDCFISAVLLELRCWSQDRWSTDPVVSGVSGMLEKALEICEDRDMDWVMGSRRTEAKGRVEHVTALVRLQVREDTEEEFKDRLSRAWRWMREAEWHLPGDRWWEIDRDYMLDATYEDQEEVELERTSLWTLPWVWKTTIPENE